MRSQRCRKSIALLAAAASFVLLGSGAAFGSIIIRDTVPLANAKMKMVILRAERSSDGKGAIAIKSIEDLDRGVMFGTKFSNIFSVELRAIPPDESLPPIKIPKEDAGLEVNSVLIPVDNLSVSK